MIIVPVGKDQENFHLLEGLLEISGGGEKEKHFTVHTIVFFTMHMLIFCSACVFYHVYYKVASVDQASQTLCMVTA